MKSYDKDFKDKIIAEVEEIGNIGAVAKKYKVPTSTIHSWFKNNIKKEKVNKSRDLIKLRKELHSKELENRILKDLLKKLSKSGR